MAVLHSSIMTSRFQITYNALPFDNSSQRNLVESCCPGWWVKNSIERLKPPEGSVIKVLPDGIPTPFSVISTLTIQFQKPYFQAVANINNLQKILKRRKAQTSKKNVVFAEVSCLMICSARSLTQAALSFCNI